MASVGVPCLVVLVLLFGKVWSGPALYHEPDARPLSAVSELSSRLATHAQDARLPLPSPQELEAIRKVAQILVMLGEQVIPTIIGEPPTGNCDPPAVEVPLDTISENNP